MENNIEESEVNKLMARSSYQYETSPRKIQPDYIPERKYKEKPKKKELTREEKEEQEKIKFEQEKNRKLALKHEKRQMKKKVLLIMSVFLIFLAISYRNSLITQKFNQLQDKKDQLAAIEKTNGQLEVSIEESLNLDNIEKVAEEKIGMQKLSSDQKVYVTLPKKDYTESGTKEIEEEDDTNWFESLINKLFK